MDKNILEINDLSVEYVVNKTVYKAVNHLSLSIGPGESLGLVGETGAGKTTTALAMMGLIPNPPGRIVSGSIVYKGENLLETKEKRMRRIRGEELSMIFQDPMTSLNPVISVGDQILEVVRLHSNMSLAQATVKAQQMLEMVGIPANRYEEYPYQFSGGMKQRVMIACALACDPTLLIADEPTTALDVTIQAQVLELMAGLKEKFNTAMLLITHDLGVVAEVCDRVAIMYSGHIVEQGSVREVFRRPMHPYTRGLFESLPRLDIDTERLNPIPGMMPDPSELPDGCAFCTRCSLKEERCVHSRPEMVNINEEHTVACWNTGLEL